MDYGEDMNRKHITQTQDISMEGVSAVAYVSMKALQGLTDYIQSHWLQEHPLNISPTTRADIQVNRLIHEHTDGREWVFG